jgi:hypothetical protein
MQELVILSALDVVIPIIVGVVCLLFGLIGGKILNDNKLKKANISAGKIIEEAEFKLHGLSFRKDVELFKTEFWSSEATSKYFYEKW